MDNTAVLVGNAYYCQKNDGGYHFSFFFYCWNQLVTKLVSTSGQEMLKEIYEQNHRYSRAKDYHIFVIQSIYILQTFWNSSDRVGRKSQGPAVPGVRQQFLFVYFVLHRKSEMPLVCRNDHGQLRIRFCFKWHLLLKHATVSMVILLIIVFL